MTEGTKACVAHNFLKMCTPHHGARGRMVSVPQDTRVESRQENLIVALVELRMLTLLSSGYNKIPPNYEDHEYRKEREKIEMLREEKAIKFLVCGMRQRTPPLTVLRWGGLNFLVISIDTQYVKIVILSLWPQIQYKNWPDNWNLLLEFLIHCVFNFIFQQNRFYWGYPSVGKHFVVLIRSWTFLQNCLDSIGCFKTFCRLELQTCSCFLDEETRRIVWSALNRSRIKYFALVTLAIY